MFDREQFAAHIYVALLTTRPASDATWLRKEALCQADLFESEMKSHKPAAPKKKRRLPVVTA